MTLREFIDLLERDIKAGVLDPHLPVTLPKGSEIVAASRVTLDGVAPACVLYTVKTLRSNVQ